MPFVMVLWLVWKTRYACRKIFVSGFVINLRKNVRWGLTWILHTCVLFHSFRGWLSSSLSKVAFSVLLIALWARRFTLYYLIAYFWYVFHFPWKMLELSSFIGRVLDRRLTFIFKLFLINLWLDLWEFKLMFYVSATPDKRLISFFFILQVLANIPVSLIIALLIVWSLI
jgi:hypothetical protein